MPIAMSTLAAEQVAIGRGQDEAVEALLAAGRADSIYAERTALHVAAATSVALLGERVLAALPPATTTSKVAGSVVMRPPVRQ